MTRAASAGWAAQTQSDARLENASLLAGDRPDGLAKVGLMVERDGRNRGQRRHRHDVGRVQAAAEACFQQRHIGAGARECEKGRGRGDLEKCDRRAGIGRLAFLKNFGKGGLVDLAAGDDDPLRKTHEVWRGIGMYTETRCPKNGTQEGHDRALAVGPGHMHHTWQMVLRPIQPIKQPFDPAEREIDDLRMQTGQPVQDDAALFGATLGRGARSDAFRRRGCAKDPFRRQIRHVSMRRA